MGTAIAKKMNALESMAARMQVDPTVLKETLMKTAFVNCKTESEFVTMMVVANTYNLNPMLKEIYAFPGKGGGVIPVVPIDGWVSIMKRNPEYDGISLVENNDDSGQVESITCSIYLKNSAHPVVITEYMEECKQDKDTWRKWPRRMLRHKALIQGARIAFGFSGFYDDDEAERIVSVRTNTKPVVALPKAIEVDPELTAPLTDDCISPEAEPESPVAGTINRAQAVKLFTYMKDCGVTEAKLRAFIKKEFDKDSTSDMTNNDLDETIAWLDETRQKAKK